MNKRFNYLCSVDGSRQQLSFVYILAVAGNGLPGNRQGFFVFSGKTKGDWKAAP